MNLEEIDPRLSRERLYKLYHGDYMVMALLSKEECEDMLMEVSGLLRVLQEIVEQGVLNEDTIPRMMAGKTVDEWNVLKDG